MQELELTMFFWGGGDYDGKKSGLSCHVTWYMLSVYFDFAATYT